MAITREYLIGLQSFETEEAYRASLSLNYSTLKEIPNGPWCLENDKVFKRSDAFEVGDYVDKYFTDRDTLPELYELEKSRIELPASLNELYLSFLGEEIYNPQMSDCILRCKKLGLWASIKDDDKLAARITKDFFDKLTQASEATGKIEMTQEQQYQALCAIANIANNSNAIKLITESDGVFIIPQFKWEFEMVINGRIRKFRVMFDFLKFDTINEIIEGIDLKTGAKPSIKFKEQLIEYRYDVQGILYYTGMMALRKAYFPEWKKCTPENFKFLYTPKRACRMPIIVPLSEKFIYENGDVLYSDKGNQPGIWKLIDDADWYLENQIFNEPRLLAENNGIVNINDL